MTKEIALIIKNNYPDRILIRTSKDTTGKGAFGFIHLLDENGVYVKNLYACKRECYGNKHRDNKIGTSKELHDLCKDFKASKTL